MIYSKGMLLDRSKHHAFPSHWKILGYIYGERGSRPDYIAYYHVQIEGDKWLCNSKGDKIHPCGDICGDGIIDMIQTKEFTNWRIHDDRPPNIYMPKEVIYNIGTWREIGRSVVEILQEHPKRTFADLKTVIENEGGYIDAAGIIR